MLISRAAIFIMGTSIIGISCVHLSFRFVKIFFVLHMKKKSKTKKNIFSWKGYRFKSYEIFCINVMNVYVCVCIKNKNKRSLVLKLVSMAKYLCVSWIIEFLFTCKNIFWLYWHKGNWSQKKICEVQEKKITVDECLSKFLEDRTKAHIQILCWPIEKNGTNDFLCNLINKKWHFHSMENDLKVHQLNNRM